jgi:hypothetical protein
MNTKTFLVFSLLLTLVLTACSPQATSLRSIAETVEVYVEMPAATEAPPQESDEMEIAATPAFGYGEGMPYPSSRDTSFSIPSTTNQMIIKDAQMDLLVEDTDGVIERVTTMVADQGGYIISARTWLENDYKRAELRMGIPSANFENTLIYLRGLGLKVLNETLSGQDVSSQYTDLKSRLSNLEATAARVREFLDEARTVEDSLRVNQTLSDLEGQIEQIQGQMKYLEGRSAYSTITLTITPQIPTPTPTPTPTPGPGWNPGYTARQASEVMVGLFKGTIDALIWIIFLAWPFVLIAVIIWLILRRIRRKPSKSNSGDE